MITTKWKTIAIVGYSAPVADFNNQDPRAHGGVCLLQARKTTNGRMKGRKINSNGRYLEIGPAFDLDDATLAQWRAFSIAH